MRELEAVALNDMRKENVIALVRDKWLSLLKGRAIARDEFARLAQPFKRPLYNLVAKSLNFSEDAEDVYQEVMMRGFKYLHSLRDRESFRQWIFSIAHNEIKRYYRRRGRDSSTPFDEALAVPPAGNPQLVGEIYRIASRLKPSQREVFFLFYQSEFSIREIHEITGLGEGNVKYILNQARNRIRLVLGGKT
ncbi:MAG: sigma-70 family RNA polymerase sigma factor [Candidatus Aminicenantes bacterium]|nr:sigma-70 family RNA polymerase sigma factor [Candidatus Aminicenantes bacterium]